jgi:hypothetical protein
VNIVLNIFTNSTESAPDTSTLDKTYRSFVQTFGEVPVMVWFDPHPNQRQASAYLGRLRRSFPRIATVKSLSDGYVQSIHHTSAKYLFQLEHDWVFTGHIKHSLAEILDVMLRDEIYHFRFNKRSNVVAGWDKRMTEQGASLKYCVSDNLSNNPHIIARDRYANGLARHIAVVPGSKGIEERLRRVGGLVSCVYGPGGWPATVRHLDGRKKKTK